MPPPLPLQQQQQMLAPLTRVPYFGGSCDSPSASMENIYQATTENYINANYVEGQGGEKRAYIATQVREYSLL